MVARVILGEEEASRLPPLTLAYVGDAVWEMAVRTELVVRGETRPSRLHRGALDYVTAAAQAKRVRDLQTDLTERESEILRRGRNAKPGGRVPKNSKLSDYRAGTGLEALLGYLYLSGSDERLRSLIRKLLDADREDAGEKERD